MIYVVGGGDNLNFRIVGGTTRPSNPTEKTIWVKTSMEITGWSFSTATPTASTGRVWIVTGNNAPVRINAVKRNAINLRIMLAKQYTGSSWVNRDMEVYLDGEWVEITQYVYNKGNDYDALTGGWSTYQYTPASDTHPYTKGVCTNTTSGFELTTEKHTAIGRCTKNAIDLTNIDSIAVNLSHPGYAYRRTRFFVSTISNPTSGEQDYMAATFYYVNSDVSLDDTKYLDVSELSGEYYIGAGVNQWDGDTEYTTLIESIRLI